MPWKFRIKPGLKLEEFENILNQKAGIAKDFTFCNSCPIFLRIGLAFFIELLKEFQALMPH
jgi:hypothetical protein